MNQFKKARQRAIETGHQVENIADLKTAGIKQENSEDKKAVVKQTSKITTTTKPKEQAVLQTENTANTPSENVPVVQPIVQNTTLSESEVQVNELNTEIPVSNSAINTSVQITESEVQSENNIPIIEKNTSLSNVAQKDIPVSSVSVNSEEISSNGIEQQPLPTVQVHQTVQEPNINNIEPEYETLITDLEPTQSVVANNAVPIPQKVTAPTMLNQPTSTVQDNLYKTEQIKPVSQPSRNASSKKSVPNIFAPKGEAKSMRKSLVLKPTSVKIAENYCAKNGGSFNELVQTLLDNFIDEYGL